MPHFKPQKISISLIFTIFITISAISQVGIGNTDPKTQLEIDGAISLREGTPLTLINALNSNLDLGTTPYSFYRITGPTADFSIRSIIAETDSDGQIVTFVNTTTENLTIVHNSGTGARRIYCPGQTDILLTGIYSTLTLQYNTQLNKWLVISYQQGSSASDDWTISGNAGTTAGTNFVGTTDDIDLVIKRNNLEGIRFGSTETVANEDQLDVDFRIETNNDDDTFFVNSTNDNVGINTSTIASNIKLEVDGGANDGIFGHSNNVGGYLGRETNITFGTPSQTLAGAGVYANNPFAGYTSTYAQSTGAATVAANINFSEVWIASYNYVENASATNNPSVIYAQLNVTGGVGGYKSPITTYMNRGTTAGNPWYTVGLNAQSISQNEDAYGIRAIVATDRILFLGGIGAGGSFTTTTYAGLTASWAEVASYYNGTDEKILGSGAMSTLVKDEANINRIMYAPEAPEILFQDFGVGKLVNGVSEIKIDPILSRNIAVDSNHPLKVFIQLEGDCKGVYVTNKSKDGFTVRELQGGTSTIDFSWQIVANRKDRKGDTDFLDSKFQDNRFPKYIKKGGFKQKIETKDVSNKRKQ